MGFDGAYHGSRHRAPGCRVEDLSGSHMPTPTPLTPVIEAPDLPAAIGRLV
jgi:hypothetical protein